ncbi:MAG: hypothetical protein ACI4RR_08320 [Eubacterium sp.]
MEHFSVMRYTGKNTPSGEFPVHNSNGITLQKQAVEAEALGLHTTAVLTVNKNQSEKSALRLVIEESEWDTDNYVFAPAALYNGNRFKSLCREYPPMLTKDEAEEYRGETVISDVPRLNKQGDGTVQLNAGDLSVPCIGYYSDKSKTGYLLFFSQKNELGNFGITICENTQNKTVNFILSSPCVRQPYKYTMCSTRQVSDDAPAVLKAGDKVTFSYTQYRFECDSICEFLNKFFTLRQKQNLPVSHPDNVPWNRAFNLIEYKYNSRNWENSYGFYKSSEADSGICRQWQTGWVGGAMNTLPGLVIGNAESREKSCKTIDFVFNKLQHKSGFLYGIFCDGNTYGDNFFNPENANIVMSRKNADALYYIAKHLFYLKSQGGDAPELWENGVRRLADAFVAYYENNGEISQFIDMESGKPYIYGSASAGLVSAGLALCASYFDCDGYMQAAQSIADDYYQNFISRGYSTGGPGEILACPDSESAFALLESFVVLYRYTENQKWLNYAKDTASLCSSWCVGYDYDYEKDTQFYERKIATTGAVWASVQNKHAAPGICTMSGESLIHLYRATGNTAYLDLLKDISHNITQYVSTPENPAYASYVWHNKPAHRQKIMNRLYMNALISLSRSGKPMSKLVSPIYSSAVNPVGRINERVNLSDWEGTNNVGELPIGSCWCEVSTMLTYLEIPAVYIQSDTGFCFALDHIECSVISENENSFTARLYNPTDYDARYRIFIDSKRECKNPLSPDKALKMQNIFLHSGESIQLEINRR